MKRCLAVGLLVLCAGAALGCQTPYPRGADAPLPQAAPAAMAEVLRVATNRARCAHGLAPLRADPALTTAAQGHAAEMAARRTLSHRLNVPGRRTLGERLRRTRARFNAAGENIAQSHPYPFAGRAIRQTGACTFVTTQGVAIPRHTLRSMAESLVDQWLASPPHRKSLLSRRYSRFGGGLALAEHPPTCGEVYGVQVFAG